MIVAVMTQPMRANYCADFLNRRADDNRVAVIVASRQVFDGIDLPPNVEVAVLSSESAALPSEQLLRSSLARRTVGWMRSGSAKGARAERTVRSMMWRLRYIDRAAMLLIERRAKSSTGGELMAVLTSLGTDEPITEIVAFDAFDLPRLVAYSERHEIPVSLR